MVGYDVMARFQEGFDACLSGRRDQRLFTYVHLCILVSHRLKRSGRHSRRFTYQILLPDWFPERHDHRPECPDYFASFRDQPFLLPLLETLGVIVGLWVRSRRRWRARDGVVPYGDSGGVVGS